MNSAQLATRSVEKVFYTYLHCRPDGSPFYVGKGAGSRSHRLSGRNRHHKNIVEKHGAESIGIFVFPCSSEDEAFADEIRHIAQLRSEGYDLSNQTYGGEGCAGRYFSKETREKMSASLKGKNKGRKPTRETIEKIVAKTTGLKRTESVRMALSLMKIGNKNAAGNKGVPGNKTFLGKTHAAESKAMMSAAKKGKPWTDARRAAQSKKKTGELTCL